MSSPVSACSTSRLAAVPCSFAIPIADAVATAFLWSPRVIVDLAGVTYIDGAGLGVLKRAGEANPARLAVAVVHDPFLTQTYPAYDTYHRLALEPARGTLVEVPLGVRSGLDRIGQGAEVLEVYQSVHGKPLINAMIARLPAQVFAAYRAEPAAMFLAGETQSASVEELSSLLSWVGAGHVLLHRDLVEPLRADALQAYLDAAPDLERAAVEGDLVLYRVVRLSEPHTAQ